MFRQDNDMVARMMATMLTMVIDVMVTSQATLSTW